MARCNDIARRRQGEHKEKTRRRLPKYYYKGKETVPAPFGAGTVSFVLFCFLHFYPFVIISTGNIQYIKSFRQLACIQ